MGVLNRFGHSPMFVEVGGNVFGLSPDDKGGFHVKVDGEIVGSIALRGVWVAAHHESGKTETYSESNKKGALMWVAKTEMEWTSDQ